MLQCFCVSVEKEGGLFEELSRETLSAAQPGTAATQTAAVMRPNGARYAPIPHTSFTERIGVIAAFQAAGLLWRCIPRLLAWAKG